MAENLKIWLAVPFVIFAVVSVVASAGTRIAAIGTQPVGMVGQYAASS